MERRARTARRRRPGARPRAAAARPAGASRCRARPGTASIASERAARRSRARGPGAARSTRHHSDGHDDREHPRDEPVIELHGRHVPEEIPPPRLEHQDLGRHDVPVHQRKRVVGEAGADARDEAAGDASSRRPARRSRAPSGAPSAPARRRARRRGAAATSRPTASRRRSANASAEVRGEPELRHARIVDQPALHHVPAERALQRRRARRCRRAASA